MPFGESVVFAHGDDGVDHRSLHEPKIACSVDDVGLGNAVDDLVEHTGAERPDGEARLRGWSCVWRRYRSFRSARSRTSAAVSEGGSCMSASMVAT